MFTCHDFPCILCVLCSRTFILMCIFFPSFLPCFFTMQFISLTCSLLASCYPVCTHPRFSRLFVRSCLYLGFCRTVVFSFQIWMIVFNFWILSSFFLVWIIFVCLFNKTALTRSSLFHSSSLCTVKE